MMLLLHQKHKVVQVTATGSSIAENRLKMTNLPNEDLIVLLTGTGSRKLAANYDLIPQNSFYLKKILLLKLWMIKVHK